MSQFVLHPQAYADLDEIWEYSAADNLDVADRVREEIYEAIRKPGNPGQTGRFRVSDKGK